MIRECVTWTKDTGIVLIQEFFSRVGMCLPGLNQYLAADDAWTYVSFFTLCILGHSPGEILHAFVVI